MSVVEGNQETGNDVLGAMTTTRRALPLVTALLLLLAACGSDATTTDAGDSGTDDAGTDDTGTDDTAAPSDDGGTDETLPPLGGGPYPIATLEVTVTHPDIEPVTYTITCLGDTATLAPPVEGLSDQGACRALADPDVQTLLVEGPPDDRICTEIYGGPDEASLVGTIDDQPVDAVISRENGCRIDDWDNVLAGILPTAIGAS
jgi:hypothetical protein